MSMVLQAVLNGIAEGALLAMMALGITLIFGVAKFSNNAHGEILTVGAYGAFWASMALAFPLWLAIPAGVLFAVVVGLLTYLLVFRQMADRPVAALLASIGVSIFLRGVISLIAGTQQLGLDVPMWRAWRFWGLRVLPMEVYVCLASFVTIYVVHLILKNTRIGIEMRAVADNPLLARTSGIHPERVNRATWTIALVVGGLAGIFVAAKTAVYPDLGWSLLLPAFAAAVLGGLGSPYGAILSGVLLGVTQNLATLWINDTYKSTIAFVVLIAVLILKPSGLTGRKEVAR
ncbi:branched-chain amino acid ABC transporter permease [Ciceribacter selenitireducens]